MHDREARAAVLRALGRGGERTYLSSLLSRLQGQSGRQTKSILRWLDESGLALHFLARVRNAGLVDAMPLALRTNLETRMKANEIRSADMYGEFRRVVEAFEREKIRFCAMKGFSLIPDFCPSIALRHQTDFDFLIAPGSIANAGRSLESLGYLSKGEDQAGDHTYATPLRHVPSADDDIYAIQKHREVDLMTSVRMAIHGVILPVPTDFFERARPCALDGFRFPALSKADAFFVQVLHVFRHLLGSWMRASWLLEIAYFIDKHFSNDDLWYEIAHRAGKDQKSRDAFGLVLSLAKKAYGQEAPAALENWCLRALPRRVETWVNEFGPGALLADLHGTKTTLFVHREFVDDPATWRSYVARRMFPFGGQSPTARVVMASTRARMKARASQWGHSTRRVVFHAKELCTFPLHAVRWKLALRSTDRQRLPMPQAASR